MKKSLFFLLAVAFIFSVTTSALATNLVTYDYTISGADLMSYAIVDGTDGSVAIDNGLYEGARKVRTFDSNNTEFRSYWASQNTAFQTYAASASANRLVEFNLWGYNGLGVGWGEIYKVNSWGDETPTSTNSNWTGDVTPWPWGTPPANNSGQIIGWDTDWADSDNATSYANGIGFDGTGSNYEFDFQVTLDMDDPAFYGNTSPWYNGVEGQMVFWFGGWTLNAAEDWTGLYEGNIVLQGAPVPEPATMFLLGSGLLGIAAASRKKFFKN